MDMPEIITQIVTNGVGVFIIAYFIYRDNKYTQELLSLMVELKDLLHKINSKEERE